MEIPLRVLLIEDAEDDALLLARQLGRGGYDLVLERVETAEAMRAALAGGEWDIVISDYSLPGFSAPSALAVLKESAIDLLFIVVSGNIGEETAVEAMRAGAHDYVVKNNLARLQPAIERELREAEGRRSAARQRKAIPFDFSECRGRHRLLAVDGRFLQVNPAFCLMLKYSEEEILKLNTFEITHPDDQALTRRLFREAETGKRKSVDYEKRFICRDGEILWAHIAMAWLHDDGGRPTYAVGLVTNITPLTRPSRKSARWPISTA